jgi:hypothetical protein
VPIAWVLALFNLVLVIWGITQQELAAYVGFYEFTGFPFYVGFGILVLSVLLFFYRRAIQDKAKITFRDREVALVPTEEQMKLLREESIQG